jgi:hypothetical protein
MRLDDTAVAFRLLGAFSALLSGVEAQSIIAAYKVSRFIETFIKSRGSVLSHAWLFDEPEKSSGDQQDQHYCHGQKNDKTKEIECGKLSSQTPEVTV